MATVQKPHDDPENIARCERFYRRTGNPIHAWAGWRLARTNGLPIPGWVAEYLDKCSMTIDKIARKVGPPPTLSKLIGKTPSASGKKVDVPASLAKGFGFSKGRGYSNSFSEWMIAGDHGLVAIEVAKRMAAGRSLSYAADEVALKLKISNSSAERAFRGLGGDGPRIVEELKSQADKSDSSA